MKLDDLVEKLLTARIFLLAGLALGLIAFFWSLEAKHQTDAVGAGNLGTFASALLVGAAVLHRRG